MVDSKPWVSIVSPKFLIMMTKFFIKFFIVHDYPNNKYTKNRTKNSEGLIVPLQHIKKKIMSRTHPPPLFGSLFITNYPQ